jgi:hypothetical protein
MKTSCLLLTLLGLSAVATPVAATTFTVTEAADNMGLGTLRWAISSANAAGVGPHTIAFRIPVGQLSGALGSQRAVITLVEPLPAIRVANLTIDGSTQTCSGGDTNAGTLGTATTVGTDAVPLPAVRRPEVELRMAPANGPQLLSLNAAGCTLKSLALHGGAVAAVAVGAGGRDFLLSGCALGSTATAASYPTDGTPCAKYGLNLTGGSGTLTNSLVGFTGYSGLNVSNGLSSGQLVVRGCQFIQNSYTESAGDAVTLGDAGGCGPLLFEHNLVVSPNSSGLQFEIGTTGRATVQNNTFLACGRGGVGTALSAAEGAAICYLQRDGRQVGTTADVLTKNVISQSQAAAIVIGYGQRNVRISQNALYANGTLSIDLIDDHNAWVNARTAVYGNGNGVTPNTGTLVTAGHPGNDGLNYPLIRQAQLSSTGTKLSVQGYIGGAAGASPAFGSAVLEFFKSDDADANQRGELVVGDGTAVGHGEARTYLGTLTAQADGSFSGMLTVQGLAAGSQVCATAWLSGHGTSEVSGNCPVQLPETLARANQPPVALDVRQVPALPSDTHEPLPLVALTATDADGQVATLTITTLPPKASGTLYYRDGSRLLPATAGLVLPYAQRGELLFAPTVGYAGSALVAYTAIDNLGARSIGQATLEIQVNAPPVATEVTYSVGTGSLSILPSRVFLAALQGYDLDGTIAQYTITALPTEASGRLYYKRDLAAVGTVVPYDQASQLSFKPVRGYSGSTSFAYIAADNLGAVSPAAAYTILVPQLDKGALVLDILKQTTQALPRSQPKPESPKPQPAPPTPPAPRQPRAPRQDMPTGQPPTLTGQHT